MKAKDIIDILTDEDVVTIMAELGSAHPRPVRDGLLFQTICHNEYGGKFKLHYHSESKTFFCYTECGSIGNIFNLVMHVKDCEFNQSYKIVCEILGITMSSMLKYGFDEDKVDNSFIEKFNIKDDDEIYPLIIRDDIVLKRFWDIYHYSWIKDYIHPQIMKMFNIKFDISNNRIIIPHYDIDNNLIGIRARNLNQDIVDSGKKYMPIVIDNILYNYPTSMNLFGLNINKNAIKKYKKIIIGESEKFVMQHKTFYGDDSIAVALNGSFLSKYQISLIRDLGVETIILALDKEFENIGDSLETEYKKKINNVFISNLAQYFTLEILWDINNKIGYKDAPTDRGKQIFEDLYRDRIIL